MRNLRRVAMLLVLACVVSFSEAQSTQAGFPTFASRSGNVNLTNLDVHFAVPIVKRSGRGAGFNLELTYDSLIYALGSTTPFGITNAWTIPPAVGSITCIGCPIPPPWFGWGTSLGQGATPSIVGGSVSAGSVGACPTQSAATNYSHWAYTDPQGTVHPLATSVVVSTDPTCGPAQVSAYATDESGFLLTVKNDGSGAAHDLAGNTVQVSYTVNPFNITVSAADRNGNLITQNSDGTFTDTLGDKVLTVSNTTDAGGDILATTYTYPVPGGTTGSVVVNYKQYPRVASGFGCAKLQEYSSNGPVFLVDNIKLNDGSKYQFAYEPTPTSSPVWISGAVTGRLASVTLPTGGVTTYGYQGGIPLPGNHYGMNCNDGTAWNMTETTSDGGMWTYGRWYFYNSSNVPNYLQTTMTDPQGNATLVNFMPLLQSGVQTNWIETSKGMYQGAFIGSGSTIVDAISTCYNGTCNATTASLPITEVTVQNALNNGRINEIDKFLDGNTGAVKEVDEYDFGLNQVGPLLRKTITTYAPLGNNILGPASVTVCRPGGTDAACNGAGTMVAQTTYGYDEGTPAPTTGITQHIAISGSRGNVTSAHHVLTANNTTQDLINTFDDTGNIVTTTDFGGHLTTYSYGAGSCNGAFITQVTLPDTPISVTSNIAHHKTSTTYDCSTGLAATSTDENGNITKYFYDNMFRPIEVDYADGGQTLTSYPDANHSVVQSKIDSSRSSHSETLFDGYGRISRKISKSGESVPFDQQDFCYDIGGRLAFRSYPYQGNGFGTAQVCSGAGDSFAYDALARVAQVTHSDGSVVTRTYNGLATQVTDEGNGTSGVTTITQSDGLGRLASVCEVYGGAALLGSGGTPASCGLDIGGSGFLTTYGYDTLGNLTSVNEGALTTRTYAYDSLSRLVSESTPEAGSSTYTYNADGMRATRVRPAPNQSDPTVKVTTTYQYDALHRLTSTVYSDGTTPSTSLVYDYDPASNPQWGGPSATNIIGRLSLASVSSSAATMAFSYDAVGRPLRNDQCTPGKCGSGYWPMTYTYDLVGNQTSATNGVGVTFNYSNNIAGRLTAMSSSLADANHPGTLFSGATYSPSQITDSLGNGEQETAGISSRGFLTSYLVSPPNGEPGTGAVVVVGAVQTYQQQTQAGTRSSAVGDVSGNLLSAQICNWDGLECIWSTEYDSGYSTLTVNDCAISVYWDVDNPTTTTDLINSINTTACSPINASPNGTGITIVSKNIGAATNYTLATSCTDTSGDPTNFSGCSYTLAFPANMSGGKDPVYTTAYDQGSTTVTVNSHADSYSWSGSSTTAASIAQGLCNKINGDGGAYATASTNGIQGQCPLGSTTIALAAKQNGQNYPLSASSSSVVNSFSVACPGSSSCSSASLTGGGKPAYLFTLGKAADGLITSATDYVNGNWTFGYDQMNRLVSANKNSGQQTFNYLFDRYGNRWQQNAPQGGPAAQFVFDNNNHFVTGGVAYDVLGEVTNDGLGNSFIWDAEGRLVQIKRSGAVVATYNYDALGRRVHGPHGSYIYDVDGHMVTQLASDNSWAYGEIYAGGRHLATYSGGTTNFRHTDWVGTKRVMTGVNGVTSETCTGFPFGDGVSCSGTDWSYNGFTDDIHDPEANLEHTLYRQYSGAQGRWLTPDPAGAGSATLSNPQSWNSYAYSDGDPVNATDVLGLGQDDPTNLNSVGLCEFDINCDFFPSSFAEWAAHYFGMQCYVDGVKESCNFAAFLLRAGAGNIQVGSKEVFIEWPGGHTEITLVVAAGPPSPDADELDDRIQGHMTIRHAGTWASIPVIDPDSIPPEIEPTWERKMLLYQINCGTPYPGPCGPVYVHGVGVDSEPKMLPGQLLYCLAGGDAENFENVGEPAQGTAEPLHVPEFHNKQYTLWGFNPRGRMMQDDPTNPRLFMRDGTPKKVQAMNRKVLETTEAAGGAAALTHNFATCITAH